MGVCLYEIASMVMNLVFFLDCLSYMNLAVALSSVENKMKMTQP